MCTAAPNVKANFGTDGTNDCYGTINFDSGAMVSYIHKSMIEHSDFVESGPRIGEFYGAGGDRLKLEPFLINIKVNVNNKGVYEFKDVLVATSDTPSRTMLVGQSDLERLGIDISFARRTVTFGRGALKGVPIPMEHNTIGSINPIKLTQWTNEPEKVQQFHDLSSKDKLDTVGGIGADGCKVEDCCVNLSKRQKHGETFAVKERGLYQTMVSKEAQFRKMERTRQRNRKIFNDGGTDIKSKPQSKRVEGCRRRNSNLVGRRNPKTNSKERRFDKNEPSELATKTVLSADTTQLVPNEPLKVKMVPKPCIKTVAEPSTPKTKTWKNPKACRWKNFEPVQKNHQMANREERRSEKDKLSEFMAKTELLTRMEPLVSNKPFDAKMMPKLHLSTLSEPSALETENWKNAWAEMESNGKVFSVLTAKETPFAKDNRKKNRWTTIKPGRLKTSQPEIKLSVKTKPNRNARKRVKMPNRQLFSSFSVGKN